MLPRSLAALSVLAPALLAQGQVLTVSDSPPADFADLQAAVDVAQPGDTILLSDYAGVGLVTVDEPLTLVADDDGSEVSLFQLRVLDLTAGGSVVVRGLRIQDLAVTDCAGPVLFEECAAAAVPFGLGNQTIFEASVTGSSQVVLVRCSFAASVHEPFLPSMVTVTNSALFLHRSELAAGTPAFAVDGADALRLDGSLLYLGESVVRGGPGLDDTCDVPFLTAGDGGDAITFTGAASSIRRLGSEVVGGAGGQFPPGSLGCTDGVEGLPYAGLPVPSNVELRPPLHLGLRASSPVRAGSATVLSFEGPPSGAAVMAVSTAPLGLFDPATTGPIHVAPPLLFVLPLGALGPAGQAQLSVPLGPLPAGVDAVQLHAQGGIVAPTGAFVAGEVTALTWLSAAF